LSSTTGELVATEQMTSSGNNEGGDQNRPPTVGSSDGENEQVDLEEPTPTDGTAPSIE
jgi:hypothetical protein